MTNREYSIDYLQLSTDEMLHKGWEVHNPNATPAPYYKRGIIYTNGVRAYTGHVQTDAILYIMSGDACDSVGIAPTYVLDRLMQGARVSRIDFAITTSTNFLTKMIKDHNSSETKLYSEMKIIVDKDIRPQTIYCGNMKERGKKGIIRAYDKGLESGSDSPAYRLELESRGKRASIDAYRYATDNSIPSIIRSRYNHREKEWFDWLMSGDTTIATSRRDVPEQLSTEIQRKMAWIEKQVIPSLIFVYNYDKYNGTKNFDRIMSQIKD